MSQLYPGLYPGDAQTQLHCIRPVHYDGMTLVLLEEKQASGF